jgi:hypothetical protein
MRVALAPNEPLWITTIILVAMAMTLMTALLLREGKAGGLRDLDVYFSHTKNRHLGLPDHLV